MSTAPTGLVQEWLARLGTRVSLDLHDLVAAGDRIMDDLLAVYTPPDFTLEPLPGSSVIAVEDGVRVDLTARLIPPDQPSDDSGVGVIERNLDTSKRWARHQKFEIPLPWAGQGRGRIVTRESALMYERLGIEEVSLNAVDYGRYVWAMCGFDFRHLEDRATVLSAIEEFAEELGLPLDRLEAVEHAWDIGSIEGPPLTMRQIADARGEGVEETTETADLLDEKILPGKALLLFSDYEGYEAVLRLGEQVDPAGRDQLLVYTDV